MSEQDSSYPQDSNPVEVLGIPADRVALITHDDHLFSLSILDDVIKQL